MQRLQRPLAATGHLVQPDVLELEDHVQFFAGGVGVVGSRLEGDAGHLADGHQVPPGHHVLVHLVQELIHARTVEVVRPVGQRNGLADHVDHVHPESVDAARDPPVHHRVYRLTHLRVLPVEVGLLGAEQVQEVLTAQLVELPRRAGEHRAPVGRFRTLLAGGEARARRCPPVPVGLLRPRTTRLLEPLVLVGGVVDDQVHHQLHAALVQARDQVVEVGQTAEQRVDVLVVGDVIAVVVLWGTVGRGQPHDVDAEGREVVEVVDDATDVAHPVAVGVGERPGIDLVDDSPLPPIGGACLEGVTGLDFTGLDFTGLNFTGLNSSGNGVIGHASILPDGPTVPRGPSSRRAPIARPGRGYRYTTTCTRPRVRVWVRGQSRHLCTETRSQVSAVRVHPG